MNIIHLVTIMFNYIIEKIGKYVIFIQQIDNLLEKNTKKTLNLKAFVNLRSLINQ